jgi:two-component system response regulator HydG
MARVLVVEDDPDSLAATKDVLQSQGHDVATAESLSGARAALGAGMPDVLLLDLMLPDGNGLELLADVQSTDLAKVVLMTGHPGIKSHIKTLSGPAIAYLTKPIDVRELKAAISAAEARDADTNEHFGLLVGEHPAMLALYETIERVAQSDAPVLVVGETGTGKELVAQAIHRLSGRSGPFVPLNCGSLAGDLAASELFGHEKGSFTGAVRSHAGAFKRAHGGTLFLDELAEMPMVLQPHFLRVLETDKVLPVGSEREVSVDARIVAATNRDPEEAIAANLLRQDLYFRLNVFPIQLPPLRARPSDIPLLVKHFIAELAPDGAEREIDEGSLRRLGAYHWPGNVRELRHVVQRALILSSAGSERVELPKLFESPFGGPLGRQGLEAGRSIRDVERELIERTLEHFSGDKRAAAETLGISLNTLYNRLNAYKDESPS